MTGSLRALLLFLPVAGVAFLLSFTMTRDPDVPWHLKTGQVILERGSLLRTNTFSSTYPDHPWPNPEWLFQVTLAALYRIGGFDAIGILKVLLTIAIAGAQYVLMVRRSGHPGRAALFTVLVISALHFRLTERPHLVSYLFFVLTLLAAERAREGPSRLPWVLPALFALWSNIHPELIMGFLALGATLVGDLLDLRFAPAGPASRQARLLVPAILCLPASCLNPEGFHALLFPFLHTFIGPIVEVAEYAPPRPLSDPVFFLMVGIVAVMFRLFRREISWSELLLGGGMALVGTLYLRATPYFFLSAAPMLHRLAAAGATRGRLAAWRWNTLALTTAVAALFWACSYDVRRGLGLDETAYPSAAAAAIEREALPGRLFNLYGDGGYLIYRLFPRFGVFQDGRLQAYPPAFMARLNARLKSQDWPLIIEEYGVNTLLLPNEGPPAPIEEWGMVFWDDANCVMVRRTPRNAALLTRLEYHLFRPGIVLPESLAPQLLIALEREMERNQRERQEPSPLVSSALEAVRARIRGTRPTSGT